MLQELGATGFDEVGAARDDLPPVARVGQRRDDVAAQRTDRVGQEQKRVRDDDGEQHVQRGQQAPRASHIEAP